MSWIRELFNYLLNWAIDLYIYVLYLRLIFLAFNVDLSQEHQLNMIKYTDPLVNPLRKIMPAKHNISLAIACAALLLKMSAIIVSSIIGTGTIPHPIGLTMLGAVGLISLSLKLLIFAIIFVGLASIFKPELLQSILGSIVNRCVAPILKLFQGIIPPMGGFEVSPVLAILTIHIMNYILANPITSLIKNLI